MTKKPKKPGKAPITKASVSELERDLEHTKKALGNKALLPQSEVFYKRRQEMIEAELARRS